MKMIKWRQTIPSLITVLAMLAGFFGILLTIEGMRANGILLTTDGLSHKQAIVNIFGHTFNYYLLAAQMIMLSMILDGIDGNVARLLKGTSDFGAELDTYVDLTAFGIAPALLIFAVTLQSNQMWRILLPAAVTLSGMVRLARFKAKDPLRGQGGYAGLPITANAGWIALFVFISETPPLNSYSLNHGKFAILFLAGIVLFTALQVTNFHYPKPTKKAAIFIPLVFIVVLLFIPAYGIQVKAAVLALIIGVLYALFGPLFSAGMEKYNSKNEQQT